MPTQPMHLRQPSLSEMLADPIVQALMASDGVSAASLEELIHSASRRSGSRKAVMATNRAPRRRKPGDGMKLRR